MTAPLFAAHPGGHCAPPSPLALFFCRVLRMPWRKQAAPEVPPTPSGAATALLADAEPVMRDRMISEVRAERNRPAPRPAPAGWATAWRDGVRVLVPPVPVPGRPPWETAPFAPVPPQAAPRPVNGRPLGTQPRRQPGAARAAGLRDRERYEPASVPLLRQVLGALRNMDTPAASYRGGWQ